MTLFPRTTSVGFYVSKQAIAIPHGSDIRCFRYGALPLHASSISCGLDPLEFLMVGAEEGSVKSFVLLQQGRHSILMLHKLFTASFFLSFFRREKESMAGRCNENKGCVNSKLTLLTTGTSAFLLTGFSRRPARIGCRCCCSGKRCYQLLPAEASVLLKYSVATSIKFSTL
jgi:hypothetical protein